LEAKPEPARSGGRLLLLPLILAPTAWRAMSRLAEDRWTNSVTMTGGIDGGIASNRDTHVPRANDIGFHVALENDLKTASLSKDDPEVALALSDANSAASWSCYVGLAP
jgi:hypothetical protein